MEKEELFQQNYSYADSQQKKFETKKRQHIKKDNRRKDKRKKQSFKAEVQEEAEVQQEVQQVNKKLNSLQSQTSKYQRLDEFWKVDIENLYRKEYTDDDKTILSSFINQQKPSIVQTFKNKENKIWNQKISLQYLYRYLSLIQQLNSEKYQFVALEHQGRKEHYVIVLDQLKNIQKAVQVTQKQLQMLAYRKQCIEAFKQKKQLYNRHYHKNEQISEVQTQIAFLVNYIKYIKKQVDTKLHQLCSRAENQPKFEPPAKVQDNYISYLIKKNLKKALENQEIDFVNHFKKLDVNEHVSGLIDSKPIIDKKDFEEYIRKRKLKKSGKKARWVLKTACSGCLSYFYQMYNPFSFCTECHARFHKYCYIPKTQGICQSCYLSKNNQTKRSRINECQLCGMKGFLYLPMDESNNAHIFCMLINGLWRFQNTQIIFQKKHIQNAIQGQCCNVCKQTNSCIYKCQCCTNHAHPLCAFLHGWNIKIEQNLMKNNDWVKLQCCNGVQRQKNEKKRRYVLNYKRCVFNQYQ